LAVFGGNLLDNQKVFVRFALHDELFVYSCVKAIFWLGDVTANWYW